MDTEIEEFFTYREELLEQSKDEEGFIQENIILSQVLPSMLDAKLIDSEDCTNSYFISNADKLKINSYSVNETGERLNLFMIDEDSISLSAVKEDLMISLKSHYESQFKRCLNFHNNALKRYLTDQIQDSSPVRPLISKISSSEGADQFDVVEIFLITLSSTVSLQGSSPQPKRIEFEDQEREVRYTKNGETLKKNLLIKKRIIDLNFLYNVIISQGSREALTVNFEKSFNNSLNSIKAADEEFFESYLCVMPAEILSQLYKEYSTRLLEKNVRSFLQFRGVNQGIRQTIINEPEKFVAYNNGLTITATKADIVFDGETHKINSLTDFQIVNGGQTTATIYFTQKDNIDISKVKVMAKINVAKEATDSELEELISNISKYSNAQSRVSAVDLNSRNPQLVKIKSLSDSVMTPSGKKWFFERAKGEFNTKLRIAGSNKKRITKEFPPERRFSKELMAKYYSAWGDIPHLVKKGGEKIFRYFIEKIAGTGQFKKAIDINRNFYEELVSKIIIFRRLEKIYGAGKNSMGQLRSAVVPYTISVLYMISDGNKKGSSFDLQKIWMSETLDNDLESYLRRLLELMNELIKKYSLSEDYGEYSKKVALWNSISESKEIKIFVGSNDTSLILKKYGISKQDLIKRRGITDPDQEVDFKLISDNVLVHSNGVEYYKKIEADSSILSDSDKRGLSNISHKLIKKIDFDEKEILFEKDLTNRLRVQEPSLFDYLKRGSNNLYQTIDYIIKTYNNVINEKTDLISEFKKTEAIAVAKKKKYTSVFDQIGKALSVGSPPNIKQIYYASSFFNDNNENDNDITPKTRIEDLVLTELIMRKMYEWDSSSKILSEKERAYVADFAWGLKNLNSFHRENVKRHLLTLIGKGFKL